MKVGGRKRCENHCPRCGAGTDEIYWRLTKVNYDEGYTTQPGTCGRCGCVFEEVCNVVYAYTEVEELPDEQDS